MKRLLFLAVALIAITACGSTNKKEEAKKSNGTDNSIVATKATKVFTLENLLSEGEKLVDKTVTVTGRATHICKHSGRRAFIAGTDPKTTLRVEAKGEIGGFNRELIGEALNITGKLRERRLTKEYIKQHEDKVREQKAGGEDEEGCESELKNIESMREWMKANGKDYYVIYFMDGESYEIVE